MEIVYNLKRYRFQPENDTLYLSVGPYGKEEYLPINQVLYLVIQDGMYRELCPVSQDSGDQLPTFALVPSATVPKGPCMCARKELATIYLSIHEVKDEER